MPPISQMFLADSAAEAPSLYKPLIGFASLMKLAMAGGDLAPLGRQLHRSRVA